MEKKKKIDDDDDDKLKKFHQHTFISPHYAILTKFHCGIWMRLLKENEVKASIFSVDKDHSFFDQWLAGRLSWDKSHSPSLVCKI